MRPTPLEVDASTLALLGTAVSGLRERAAELAGGEGGAQDELEVKLEALSESVRLILDGGDPGEVGRSVLSSRRDIRLVHALRAEVLGLDANQAPAPAALTVLRAVEMLLSAVIDDDPDDLQALMAQPDAFEVLLEIAHDLRSPLTSILFLTERLRGQHSGEINELQRSQLGLIYGAAFGLVTITSDMMDLARDEQWWVDQGAEPFSVLDLLQSVDEMVRPMAEEKHIDLLLSPPHHDHAYGHPGALSRVLLNLTTNAIKFTDKGFVELGAERSGRGRMEYFVRDSGRGISPEMQSELFRPMKRRRGGDGQFFSGAGLGLSIARRILRSIGSDLKVESAPDWGSRFSFLVDELPVG